MGPGRRVPSILICRPGQPRNDRQMDSLRFARPSKNCEVHSTGQPCRREKSSKNASLMRRILLRACRTGAVKAVFLIQESCSFLVGPTYWFIESGRTQSRFYASITGPRIGPEYRFQSSALPRNHQAISGDTTRRACDIGASFLHHLRWSAGNNPLEA